MREKHPYGEYIPKTAQAMIVGTFPIGKFSDPKRKKEIRPHEIEFFFGGERNLLWKLLSQVYSVPLTSKEEIIAFLEDKRIAVGDVIQSCRRKEGGGSDSDLYDIVWNEDLLKKIRKHHIKKLFFTSKKVETFFNKLFPETDDLEKVTLISPSGQSLRSLYHRKDFARWVKEHPHEEKVKFILEDYKSKFETVI